MSTALETLETFTIESLPNLDVVVLGALELFQATSLPEKLPQFKKPLVVGSAGALAAGRILFADKQAIFADESSYKQALDAIPDVDGAVVISASGSKHAIEIATYLKNRNISATLWTNNPTAPASEYFDPACVFLFPRNREPYTYNTSTYMSMVFAKTHENPGAVKDFISQHVDKRLLRNFADYGAYTFILPTAFGEINALIRIKFDEMFAPIVTGRAFTTEEIKHAKTVIVSGDELFISLGEENISFGLTKNRLHIPLPDDANFGAVMAIAYYIVGKIQEAHPAYFKSNIVAYTQQASKLFNQDINPIVS